MKRSLFIMLLMLAVTWLAQPRVEGQAAEQSGKPGRVLTEREREARDEISAAARDYRDGKFVEAQRHAERALELVPENKLILYYLARSIHAQHKPGVETPENIFKAREAISAYQKILVKDPLNEEAYKAVAALYGSIREEDLQRDWIIQRASNTAVPTESRVEAYTTLAGKDWNCAYQLTERADVKQSMIKGHKVITRYKMPEDQDEFNRAHLCATRGLEMAALAISLDQRSDTAWSFKSSLLLEMAKLAEMSGQHDAQAEYARQADEARKRLIQLGEENQEGVADADGSPSRQDKVATTTTTTSVDPALSDTAQKPQGKRNPVSGGVLNGKAISMPKPVYPRYAIAAHASGTVSVEITIDEAGNVIRAHAVSGHPLLQAAAVEAARLARFSPVTIAGEPVRVTGTITYNFVP